MCCAKRWLTSTAPALILDVAELATPSLVEAVLSRNAHQFDTAGTEFVVWGAEAPYDGTLREIYADLTPVAVVHGKKSPNPGEVVPCPGRDLKVYAGDWTSMIGIKDELETRGITVPPRTATRSRHSRCRRIIDSARAMRDDLNPLLFPSLALALFLVLECDSRGPLHLPEAADDVDRRSVLHLRNHHDGGLRRLQLRPTNPLPAAVRRRV